MQEKESLTKSEDLSKHYSPTTGDAFISNKLDSLSESFVDQFKNSLRSGCLRQIVIIPSNDIKNYLTQRIKKEGKRLFWHSLLKFTASSRTCYETSLAILSQFSTPPPLNDFPRLLH